jgi:hypothetical protein
LAKNKPKIAVKVEKMAVIRSKNSAKTSKEARCFFMPKSPSNNTPNPIGKCKIKGCKCPIPARGKAKLDWKIKRKTRKP